MSRYAHYTVRRKKLTHRSIEDARRIRECIKTISDKRGGDNEDKVESVLEGFKQQGLIKHYYSTKHWSKKDRNGIDFVVILCNGFALGFDSKSSWRGIENHEMRHLKKGNNIWDIKTFPVRVTSDYCIDITPLEREIKKIIQSEDPEILEIGLP